MKNKHLSTSVDEKTYIKARFIAKQELQSVSGLIRFLLRKHIEQYEKENYEVPQ